MEGKANRMCLQRFTALTLWSALTIVVVRLFELLFVTYYGGSFLGHLLNNLLGLCFDFFYFSLASIVLCVPFCLLFRISEHATSLAFRIVYAVVSLVAMLLVGYFSQTGIPLDRVFFMYSLRDILDIVATSQTTVWWMYICIAFVPVFFFITSGRDLKINKITVFIMALVFVACVVVRIFCYNPTVNNSGYYEQCNKIVYFAKSLFKSPNVERNDSPSAEEIAEFQAYFPEKEFVSHMYPFLYQATPDDVLGSYFDLGEKMPNIVLIVVEGLGRENSGRNSKYVSTTPFLDSLAQHSLYWLNCLSVSQRTAGVFPAIFGALPFGREGFMAYKRNAPCFNSLPKILKENGYDFSFYYGGKKEFDNMDDFFWLNGATPFFAEQYAQSTERSEWGLYDKFLFSEAVKKINFDSENPRFDVFLTLTSHMPWDYPDREKYMGIYTKMESEDHKPHHKDILPTAAYLYVDEAIKQLITDYSHRPGFDNTIFIITGDHNYYLYTFVLERYHVPLLIWSPMLKKNACFPAVVCHREVTPTILNMLFSAYGIQIPDEVAWLNGPLDTSSVFRSKTFVPQMDASRNIVNMLFYNYFIDNEDVYEINYKNCTLGLEPVTDTDGKVMKFFNLYKTMDKYVCDNDMLVKSQVQGHYRWLKMDGIEDLHKDTVVVKNRMFPLSLVEINLKERYKAISVHFDMEFHFDEENAKNGVSMGFIIRIVNKDGKIVYEGLNELRSFDELVKPYQFNEVIKQSTYHYSDGDKLEIFLLNWSRLNMKIVNVNSSVKVSME